MSKRSDIFDVRNMSFREIERPMDSILNRNKEYGGGRPMKEKEFDAVRMMREIRSGVRIRSFWIKLESRESCVLFRRETLYNGSLIGVFDER